MNQFRLSFDVDGTLLDQPFVQKYAKKLVNEGFDVWITTRRFDSVEKYSEEFKKKYGIVDLQKEHNQLFVVAKKVGIPLDKIRFTNMEDKYFYFGQNSGFLWHLDDDHTEIRDINRLTDTIGISFSNGSNWRHKCEKLIKQKLNENI